MYFKIAFLGFADLLFPPVRPRLRKPEVFAVRVTVPVAAVDKDDRVMFRQHDVRATREFFVQRTIHGETKSVAVQERPEQAFGLGVLPRDSGHDPTALLFVEDVCHLPEAAPDWLVLEAWVGGWSHAKAQRFSSSRGCVA